MTLVEDMIRAERFYRAWYMGAVAGILDTCDGDEDLALEAMVEGGADDPMLEGILALIVGDRCGERPEEALRALAMRHYRALGWGRSPLLLHTTWSCAGKRTEYYIYKRCHNAPPVF